MSRKDEEFLRKFAMQIAQELREQEGKPYVTNIEESVPKFYRSLCFDEPMIDDDVTFSSSDLPTIVSSLCEQLLHSSSKFALSNRLVNGIVFLCRQRNTNINTNNPSEKKSRTPPPPPRPTEKSVALAKLAFCVLIQVPLECYLNMDDLQTVRKFLGTYKCYEEEEKSTNNTATNNNIEQTAGRQENDSFIDERTQAIIAASNNDNKVNHIDNNNNNNDETDSLQEVWAAESDPSDYDYGEGVGAMPAVAGYSVDDGIDDQEQLDWLDPFFLSKPDDSLVEDQVKSAIGSLLKLANYNLFEPLFLATKSPEYVETAISQITQLLLISLKPTTETTAKKAKFISDDDETTIMSSYQSSILSPLWVLRDAALQQHATHNQQKSSRRGMTTLSSQYLELLQTLLAVDQAHLQDIHGGSIIHSKQTTATIDLCSASVVGLSALSSWCSLTSIPIPVTTSTIVDSMNDLSHVIERGRQQNYDEHLRHSLVPILEVLTGINYDEIATSKSTMHDENKQIPQELLSSGLLREILSLALSSNDEKSFYFHHVLWSVSVAYPNVVGKYVYRYPGITKLIRSYGIFQKSSGSLSSTTTLSSSSSGTDTDAITDNIKPRDYVNAILWHVFASTQVSQKQQAPRIIWKSKSNKSGPSNGTQTIEPPLTKDECSEVLQKAWDKFCHVLIKSYNLLSEKNNDKNNIIISPSTILTMLLEWKRLYNLLQLPILSICFRNEVVKQNEGMEYLQQIKQSLTKVVQSIPINKDSDDDDDKIIDSNQGVVNHKKKKDDIDDNNDVNDNNGDEINPITTKKRKDPKSLQLVLSQTRHLLKQYTLFFQGNDVSGSSKTD